MLGLMIHFFYFSQPSVSKICSLSICAFIRVYFWVFGKILTTFTLQVYTHFFSKTGYDQWNFIQRKVGSYLFSQACCFLARKLFIFIYFLFFFILFLFLLALFSFSSFFSFLSYLSFVHFLYFFSFSLWKGHADEGAHYLLTSNHKVSEKNARNGKSQKKTVTK